MPRILFPRIQELLNAKHLNASIRKWKGSDKNKYLSSLQRDGSLLLRSSNSTEY